MPAIFLTVPYFGLQPLQSSSLTALGATAPVATVVAVLAEVDAPAGPVRLSWQMTAAAIAGPRSSRHPLRPPPGGDPCPDLVDDLRADQGERIAIPSRSCAAADPGAHQAMAVPPVCPSRDTRRFAP